MPEYFQLDNLEIEVVRKPVKNINLTVLPPSGKVRISAPTRVSLSKIKSFAQAKRDWIVKSQQQMCLRDYIPPLQYFDGETHSLWGETYPLKIEHGLAPGQVFLANNQIVVITPRVHSRRYIGELLDYWYAGQAQLAARPLIAKWEPIMKVRVKDFTVRKMKTLWGSCTPLRQTIRLNSDLAKTHPAYFEYIVVHEMVHLLEGSHNWRFQAFMDRFLPNWRIYQADLDSISLRPCA